MAAKAHILVVDDEPEVRYALKRMLDRDYDISEARSGNEALVRLLGPEDERPDLVMLDHYLNDMEGPEVQQALLDRGIDIPMILVTGRGVASGVIKASQLGAAEYLSKPFTDNDQVLEVVERVLRQSLQRREHTPADIPEIDPHEKVIGRGAEMLEIFRKIGLVANTNQTVLIGGETGTGKTLLAETIHLASDRKRNPFVGFNCAGIPETLLEGELFGSEKGAYTSSDKLRIGRIESANKGTLFLDEIGDMTLATQVKLLKVLDSHQIERLGSSTPIKVDVRIVAATHRNLAREVMEGRFRADLYYRLNVFPIFMPPLRDRKDDIPALVSHFLRIFRFKPSLPAADISPEALVRLSEHDWPGNVRELMNVVQRAIIYSQGELVMPEHIIFSDEVEHFSLDVASALRRGMHLDDLTLETQRLAVRASWRQSNGDSRRAASHLGVSIEEFRRMAVEFGLLKTTE